MMSWEQYLLGKLAEEAGEVAKEALKAQYFGLNDIHPELGNTNRVRIHHELNDLNAIIAMLNADHKLGYIKNNEEMVHKIIKVNRYAEYMRSLRRLEKVE